MVESVREGKEELVITLKMHTKLLVPYTCVTVAVQIADLAKQIPSKDLGFCLLIGLQAKLS